MGINKVPQRITIAILIMVLLSIIMTVTSSAWENYPTKESGKTYNVLIKNGNIISQVCSNQKFYVQLGETNYILSSETTPVYTWDGTKWSFVGNNGANYPFLIVAFTEVLETDAPIYTNITLTQEWIPPTPTPTPTPTPVPLGQSWTGFPRSPYHNGYINQFISVNTSGQTTLYMTEGDYFVEGLYIQSDDDWLKYTLNGSSWSYTTSGTGNHDLALKSEIVQANVNVFVDFTKTGVFFSVPRIMSSLRGVQVEKQAMNPVLGLVPWLAGLIILSVALWKGLQFLLRTLQKV